jgi:putative isomerase
MNFLVYLGLRRYDVARARVDLAEKSQALLLKEWREKGHVHENYNPETGEGCDRPNSDSFYHWGGLLGLIAFIEAGAMPAPEAPLETRTGEIDV